MSFKRAIVVLLLFIRFVSGTIEEECLKARSQAAESCVQTYRKELEGLGCTNANDYATYRQVCNLNWPESNAATGRTDASPLKINELLLWPAYTNGLVIDYHIDWSNLPNYSQEKAGLMKREMTRAFEAWGSIINVQFNEIQDANKADLQIKFSGQTYPSGSTSNLIEGFVRKLEFKSQVDAANANKCHTKDPIREPMLQRTIEFNIHDYEDYKFDIEAYKAVVNDAITLLTKYGLPDAWSRFVQMIDEHKFGYSFYTIFLTQVGQFLGLDYANVGYDTVMTAQANQFIPDLTPFDVFYIKLWNGLKCSI